MNKTINPSKIKLKRVYESAAATDGTRILVDRLWPRGLSKEKAGIDHWCKDVAPSAALRKWFGHEPERWEIFRKRYKAEIAATPETFAELKELASKGRVTLVYAAHDEDHNNAVVLHELLCAGKNPSKKTAKTSAKASAAPKARKKK